MFKRILFVLTTLTLAAGPASAQQPPEVDACKASAVIALQKTSPEIKEVILDLDGLMIAEADTKIEDTPIKTIIYGDAYLKTDKTDKPRQMLCIIGEKGKVLLTFFTKG